ncbi:MAG: hypothetical protein H0T57_10085 [Rubrobacter sp.]|nr:hypothetical protein [Rubrobacter sp.]MBA3616823.1 hypothetical protein [Rubrobacteraceae bacterium]
MTSFIALYRGETVSGARLVALTADPQLVKDFAGRLIADEAGEAPRPDLRLVERSVQNTKNVRRPTAGLEQVGRIGETDDKENSACGRIIPD